MNEDLIKGYERPEAEFMAEWNKSGDDIDTYDTRCPFHSSIRVTNYAKNW